MQPILSSTSVDRHAVQSIRDGYVAQARSVDLRPICDLLGVITMRVDQSMLRCVEAFIHHLQGKPPHRADSRAELESLIGFELHLMLLSPSTTESVFKGALALSVAGQLGEPILDPEHPDPENWSQFLARMNMGMSSAWQAEGGGLSLTERFTLLAKAGVDLNVPSDDGRSALRLALEDDNAVAVAAIIRAIRAVEPDMAHAFRYEHPIKMAIEAGALASLEACLYELPDLFRQSLDLDDNTALHLAAYAGREEVVGWLIDKAAVAVGHKNRFSMTALDFAAKAGYEHVVRMLRNSADNAVAAWHAVRAGSAEALEALLEQDVDVRRRFERGGTLLHLAAERGDEKLIDILLRKGCEVGARNHNGFTPLACAAAEGRTAALAKLLGAGADIHSAAHEGMTALHLAAKFRKASAVAFLVRSGADPARPNAEGDSALDIAAQAGRIGEVSDMLGAAPPREAIERAADLAQKAGHPGCAGMMRNALRAGDAR